ncbi:zinc finger protein 789 isoform X10 [Equus asinus]|uniref:zinc finger protein 789 isoform X10 n=1 Tax=Equus asinus TaxID=9793 RepID=UPI001D05ABE2|nr:zinc finger protein 789 isoform X14 [Equus asinus]
MALAAEARLGRRLSSAAEAKALDGGRALAEPAEGGRARGPIAPSRSDSHEVHRVQDFDEQVFQILYQFIPPAAMERRAAFFLSSLAPGPPTPVLPPPESLR